MFSIRRQIVLPLNRSIRLFNSPPARQKACPSCSRTLPSLLPACTNCGHISHLPQDTRFHDVFGLPYEPNPFIIDLATLKQRFRNAQTLCHPDNWAAKGSNKQDIAQTLSARINEAYQCLLDPLARAEYILERHHIPISETDQVDNMEFMSEIMQARETIEEAGDENEVASLLRQNDYEIKNTEQELERLVEGEQWDDVKSAAVRLRYLQGIARAGKKWLDSH